MAKFSKGYSDLKVIHDITKMSMLKSWRRTSAARRPAPGQIQLILSDLCNHDCSFCAYRLSGYTSNQNFDKTKQIPTEKALEIVKDAAALGVRGVQFTGGGEPTVHREHLQVMQRCLDLDLACGLVTNGCLLREGWEAVLPALRWIRFSMDAGNAADYASIRRVKPSRYEHMLGNMRKLADEIKRQGTDCTFGASFIVTKENYLGIATAAKAAKEAGVTYFRIGAFYNNDMQEYYAGLILQIEQQIDKATHENGPDFVFDQFSKRVHYMAQSPENPFCGYQHLNVYVGGDQKVYRCCEYSYNDHGFVGDLRNQSFRQWWEAQETDERYRCFDATKCVTCPFHTKNELIEFMTRADISEMHPEFP